MSTLTSRTRILLIAGEAIFHMSQMADRLAQAVPEMVVDAYNDYGGMDPQCVVGEYRDRRQGYRRSAFLWEGPLTHAWRSLNRLLASLAGNVIAPKNVTCDRLLWGGVRNC